MSIRYFGMNYLWSWNIDLRSCLCPTWDLGGESNLQMMFLHVTVSKRGRQTVLIGGRSTPSADMFFLGVSLFRLAEEHQKESAQREGPVSTAGILGDGWVEN